MNVYVRFFSSVFTMFSGSLARKSIRTCLQGLPKNVRYLFGSLASVIYTHTSYIVKFVSFFFIFFLLRQREPRFVPYVFSNVTPPDCIEKSNETELCATRRNTRRNCTSNTITTINSVRHAEGIF